MARKQTTAVLAVGGPPRVNLMPRTAIERRERAALLRRWGWGATAALLVVALVSGGAYYLHVSAQQRLDAENTRTTALLEQVAALQVISGKLSLQTELAEFRAQAMGTEVDWGDLIAAVQRALPEGVAYSAFELSPGGLAQGDDPALEIGAQGEIELSSLSPWDIVDLTRAVRAVPGILAVDGWGQNYDKQDDVYRHLLRVQVDQSFYTGAYVAEEEE